MSKVFEFVSSLNSAVWLMVGFTLLYLLIPLLIEEYNERKKK